MNAEVPKKEDEIDSARKAIPHLNLIIVGALLCFFDLSQTTMTGDYGYKLDLLNDAVGAGVIAFGVFSLSRLKVHRKYRRAMNVVKVVSVVAIVDAVRDHFVFPVSIPVQQILLFVALTTEAASVLCCIAMRWLCANANLHKEAQSWDATAVLFVTRTCLIGSFFIASVVAPFFGKTFVSDGNSVETFGILLLMLAGPVLFIVSTRCMKSSLKEIEVEHSGMDYHENHRGQP